MRTLTGGEWASIVLAVLSVLLLLRAVTPDLAAGFASQDEQWVFLPHIILIALIIGGVRRLALVLQSFILVVGIIVALGVVLDNAMGGHSGREYEIAAVLQVPLFILCLRSGKTPFNYSDLTPLGPRLALGVLAGVVCWFAAGVGITAAGAPARALKAATLAKKHREWAKRDALRWVEVVGACLQQSPVTSDSQPYFPAALAELPHATCPEAAWPAPAGFIAEYHPGAPDSAGKRRGFRLTMHDSLPSDTANTYETDESMVIHAGARQFGLRFAVGAKQPRELLGSVGRCIEEARDTAGPHGTDVYPASVVEARRRHYCDVGTTADSSAFRQKTTLGYYLVRYAPPAAPRPHDMPGGFTLLVEPARDSLGRGRGGALLSFFSDTDGVVHVTRRPRPATAADPPIPDCVALFGYRERDEGTPCREYRLRQRWGVSSELPTVALSFSGSGTLGVGEEIALLPHFRALLPRDSVVEVRVRWDSGGRDTVLAHRRGARFGKPIGNGEYFEFRHAWADTGMKRVEVHVLTAGHEDFETHEDIHVVAVHR